MHYEVSAKNVLVASVAWCNTRDTRAGALCLTDFDSDSTSGQRASPGAAAAWRVVALGIAISALLAAYIAFWERRGVQEDVRDLTSERTELLASTMRVSMQVLYSLQSLHAATRGITPDAFALFARDVRQRHPELQALEWAPRVNDADREAFEAGMRRGGSPGFRIIEINSGGVPVAAARRATYFPVQLIEPMRGNEPALGLDMLFDARRRAALERARETGMPAATAPIHLAQDQGHQPGFLVFLPLYNGQSGDAIEGFVLAVFRFQDLIAHAMRDMDGRGISFTIDDVSEQPAQRVFGPVQAAAAPAYSGWYDWILPADAWHDRLDIAGRQWQLNFVPESGFVIRHLPWQTFAIFVIGLSITALTAAFVRLLALRGHEVARANIALSTEIARREEAVQAALASSRSKSTFLANMSHEIRTPMNAVLGYAQLLRRDAGLDDVQRDAVNAILTSGSHLMNQINEVLDFSKIESGVFELHRSDFDLNATLRDLERMFRSRCREKHLALVISELPAAQAWVHGDAIKLQQILVNLLGNAVRFTSVGEIALRARVEDSGWYRFEVIDTGPGVAEADRERIFEPFYQSLSLASLGGSGLGLAIAKRQAELMGGELSVTSEPGAGSVFAFRAPLSPASDGGVRITERDAARWTLLPGPPLGILVVDDIAINRDVLARILRDAGCVSHEAASAADAMQMMKSRLIDVVFMDIRMPEIDGLAGVGMMDQLAKPPKVIAYTAAAFEQDREQLLAAGCDGIVHKPIDIDKVFETLAKVSDREFARGPIAGDEDSSLRALDFARLRVPPALLQRMVTAAELHSATVLKACLLELRADDPEQDLLARHLRHHLRAYDMNSIARVLMQVLEEPAFPFSAPGEAES
jgi:signal transduction histidine kinase/CheY-like chemotaxis protein